MAGLIEQAQGGQHPPGIHTMPDGTVMDGDMPVDPGMQQVAEMPEDDMDEGPDPDTDPAFRAALQFAMTALYENGAADGVARALQADASAQTLADTAYKMVEVVDERTEASVPEELMAVLGMQILKEVVDVGEAAGVEFRPSEIALAFREMILRYVEESGEDTTQLRAAMDEIDPAQFDAIAGQGEMQDEQEEEEEEGDDEEGVA